jgi:acyl dehydratase
VATVPEVGTTLPEREFRITRQDLVRYAGAAGDFNPIHWSDRVAVAVGLPGVIAHGMLTMALAGRVLTVWAGDPAAVVEYGVRFARPVVVPDDDRGVVLTVGGVVTEIRDDEHVGVEVSVRVGGEKVLTHARAVVRPPADG